MTSIHRIISLVFLLASPLAGAAGITESPEAPAPAPAAAPANSNDHPNSEPAASTKTPGSVMEKTYDDLRIYRISPAGYEYKGIAREKLAAWIDKSPGNACDLQRWSRVPATGDMPIVWDNEAEKYFVSEKDWSEAPPAIQVYTWNFLLAYGHLPSPLRKSHSVVAIGTAGVIAAEIVNPWKVSDMPDDVATPSAVVSIFKAVLDQRSSDSHEATSPDFIEEAATGKLTPDLVAEALKEICKVGANASVPADYPTADTLMNQRWEHAAAGQSLKLSHLMPNHPLSLQKLDEAVKSIPHPTLRYLARAAVAQQRFTMLPGGEPELTGWKTLADETESDVTNEVKRRGASALVPAWSPKTPAYLGTAPQTVRPVAAILLAEASWQVLREWESTGAPAAEAKLRAHPAFHRLCALAGQVPDLKMPSKPEMRDEAVFLGKMIFKNMVRFAPEKGEVPAVETVEVDLIAVPPTGDAEPIRGFSADAFVYAKMPGKDPAWIPAATVATGMQVLGHVPMGDPAAGLTTRLNDKVRAEWFTVTKVHLYENVPDTVIVSHKDGWNLALAIPQHLLLDLGGIGVWVEALKLDAGFISYSGKDQDGKPFSQSSISAVQETKEPQRLVSLSLSDESDEIASYGNNVVVCGRDDGTNGCDTVECTSGDVSMVVETEELATKNGKTALKNLVANATCEQNPQASIAEAYLEKPEESPWQFPPYLKGEVYITLKNEGVLLRAVSLVVEDSKGIGRDFICSRNTKLRAVTESGAIVARRACNAKVGEKLISDFAADGKTPSTVRVTRVQDIDLPDKRFIALTLANLKLAPCGPLLVEWEGRQVDMYRIGVAPNSRLALARTTGAPATGGAPSANDAEVCVSGSIPVESARGAKIAVFDPFLGLMGANTLGDLTGGFLTRMLTVKADGAELKVAGSQGFWVQNDATKTADRKLAYQLIPGDLVLIAKDKESLPKPVAVENVVPQFACNLSAVELCSGSTQAWHKGLPIQSDICFAESMSVVTKVPGLWRKEKHSSREPDTNQPGAGSGHYSGQNSGDTSNRVVANGGSVVKNEKDAPNSLDLTDEDIEQFKHNALLIGHALEGELDHAHSVAKSGKLQLLDSALKAGDWPYDESPEKLRVTLHSWVAQALQRRGAFLSAADWAGLPRICLQDVTLAAWLDAAGCKETARLFASDAIELSLAAGCSQKAVNQPALTVSAGLGTVLAASKWAAPGQNGSPSFNVNPISTRKLKDWAVGLKMDDRTGRRLPIQAPTPQMGIVQLDELYVLWTLRAQEPRPWPDLTEGKSAGRNELVEWLTNNCPQ